MRRLSFGILSFVAVSVSSTAVLAWQLLGDDKRLFTPGRMSYAHYQIELACASCHGARFGGDAAIERKCRECHATELEAMGDAHAAKKFSDPRNADWLAKLDATQCLACHKEHVPEQTAAMMVSVPDDFCIACHADVANERPSHRGVAAARCADAGCHNFHDNGVLHEDFIRAHLNEPDLIKPARRPDRRKRPSALSDATLDTAVYAIADERKRAAIQTEWNASGHANGQANCGDCHARAAGDWRVDVAACDACHESQVKGFSNGHHGMRVAALGKNMTVAEARLPMRKDAKKRVLDCNSCHAAHRYDTRRAEAEACLGCHADEHSLAWRESAHAKRWLLQPDEGASCASCHMPRYRDKASGDMHVAHNQSALMRPQVKMLKGVCMQCHGLPFALRALSAPELVRRNFAGPVPDTHSTLEWVARQKRR